MRSVTRFARGHGLVRARGRRSAGSSVAHLDQDTYSDVQVGLMTPNDFGPGFDQVDILAAAIMRDLGYQGVVAAR